MTTGTALLLAAAAVTILAGPLGLGLAGAVSMRRADATPASGGGWRFAAASMLVYVFAFNLTFFIQELFLVLPKALTPGLRPTLYHNNHGWEGRNPLAGLFQGTGALATLSVGLLCLWLLRRPRPWPVGMRLFVFWMAYCGCFMALPQVVIGALSAGSDVGTAMAYLQLGEGARIGAAIVALGLMPLIARRLCGPALELADAPARVAGPGARMRLVFRRVTLPALVGTALILPFRVPRELVEVVLVPLLVMLCGIPWIQTGAWRVREIRPGGDAAAPSLVYPLAAVVGLLLFFQLVLRPGIHFYGS
jgi:hypothetical protein